VMQSSVCSIGVGADVALPHQEKCSEIIIDCKEVTKTVITIICCNQLAVVDIGYNPIIIVLQLPQMS